MYKIEYSPLRLYATTEENSEEILPKFELGLSDLDSDVLTMNAFSTDVTRKTTLIGTQLVFTGLGEKKKH